MIEAKEILMTVRQRVDGMYEVHYRSLDGSPLFAGLLDTTLVEGNKKKMGEFLEYVFEDSNARTLLDDPITLEQAHRVPKDLVEDWNVGVKESK